MSPMSNHQAQGTAANAAPAPLRSMPVAPMNTSNSSPSTSAPHKSRVALACKRCKRRKQRCDGAQQVCKSCEKAGVACVYERTIRPQYPGGKSMHINALEERVAFLEGRLPDYAEDHFDIRPDDHQEASPTEPGQSPSHGPPRYTHEGHTSEGSERPSLVDGVAYLSLCASGTTDKTFEPYYVGSSSGATIARVIQSSIYRGEGNRATRPPQAVATHLDRQPGALSSTAPSSPTRSDDSMLDFPDLEQARMLFDVFFERIHTRWPLLDRVVYTDLFHKQYIPGSLTTIERSIFHLIYAITARFLALTRKPCSVDSERHLVAATDPMGYIIEQHNLATVQFLLLLGIHGQRSPYGAGAWSQVRYATSVCIEMGLHRRRARDIPPEHARDVEIRRRAFWSCYCLDRVTSIVLGRAFAIADRDINVELPSASPEFWSLTHQEAPDPTAGQWSNVEPFIHIIKLDRIQSRIHKAVFRVDRDVFNGTPEERAKLDRKMVSLRADLDEWVQTCPQTPKEGNKTAWMYDPESALLDARDFYGLQYHKAVLFLFTIFLPTLDTSDPRFITCARSAACVCTAYKRLNQNRTLTYTMISLHSCFVAGLTLVYCAWRDRSLFDYDALDATRACSQSLTIFGEKWPGAVKYRDTFDALSGSLLKTIVNPGPMMPPNNGTRPLHFNMDVMTTQPLSDREDGVSRPQPGISQNDRPTMSHMMSDAVKEAFMEVDEEAPGGWQGWRMWNEMVRDDAGPIPAPVSRFDGSGYGQTEMGWNPYDGSDFYGVDPVQDAAMQMGNYGMMDDSQWEFGRSR